MEESFDIELGTTRHYRVDYIFEREDSHSSAKASYVNQKLFDSLQPEDAIPRIMCPGGLGCHGRRPDAFWLAGEVAFMGHIDSVAMARRHSGEKLNWWMEGA